MLDKYAPPVELWDAAKCARILGFKNADSFKHRVRRGDYPPPVDFIGNVAQWSAEQIRAARVKLQPKGTLLYECGRGRHVIRVYADGKGGEYSVPVVE